MEMFYVTADVTFTLPFPDGSVVNIFLKKPKDKPDVTSIYAGTGACLEILKQQVAQSKPGTLPADFKIKTLDMQAKRRILALEDFPIMLSNFDSTLPESDFSYNDPLNYKKIPCIPFVPLEEKIKDIETDELKVYLINGMGTGLGDGLVGLTALNIFYKKLEKKFDKITIDSGQPSVIGDKNHQALYNQESLINHYEYLPITVDKLMDYHLLMDNSGMIIRENFPGQSMIDFFLENLAIDPKTVSSKEKKLFIKTGDKAKRTLELPLKLLRQDPEKKLILLHTSASSIVRSMPRDMVKKVIKQILDADKNYIVVTWENMNDIKDDINNYLGIKSNRHVNLFFKNTAFDLYTYLISQMDGIVTVDTSSYHIANAFDIPTVVIFQTIDPKLRIGDYEFCNAVELSKNNALKGIHVSQDQKHIETMLNYWRSFDTKKIITELKTVMIKKRVALADKNKKLVECTVCNTLCENKVIDRAGTQEIIHCNNCETDFIKNKAKINFNEKIEQNIEKYKDASAEDIFKPYLSAVKYEPWLDFMHTINPKNKKYLDYNCGIGELAFYAKSQLKFDVYGNTTQEAIKFAKQKFELNSLTTIFDETQKYDIISSLDDLQYQDNPIAFIEKLYNSLNTGGYLFLLVPNRNRLQFTSGEKNVNRHTAINNDFANRFTSKSIDYIFSKTKFNIIHNGTTKAESRIINDISGNLPDVNIQIDQGKTVQIPKNGLATLITQYTQPAFDGITGLGEYLFVVAKKTN